mmetsp:Transcript_47896/g.51784  ORF Transcript_47896/g.51784 Transcript_47896/m.51784 type:complete len:511 (+) Transcript_47896:153-1685(+)
MDSKNYNTLPDGVAKPSPTTILKSKKGMPRSLVILLMTLLSLALFSTTRLSSTRGHTTSKLAGASTGSIVVDESSVVEAVAEQQEKTESSYQIPLQHFYIPGEFAMKLSSPAFTKELTFYVDSGSTDTVVPAQCFNYGQPEVTILDTNLNSGWQTNQTLVQAPVTVTDTKGKPHTIDFVFWVNNMATHIDCSHVFSYPASSGAIGIMPGNNCHKNEDSDGEEIDLEMPSLTFALAQVYKKETNANLGFGVISEKPPHYKDNIEKGWPSLHTSIVIGDCPRKAVWTHDTYDREDITTATKNKAWYQKQIEGYKVKAYHSNFINGFNIDFFNDKGESIDSIAGAGWLDTGGPELQYRSKLYGNKKYASICYGSWAAKPEEAKKRNCLHAGTQTNVTYTGEDGEKISYSFKSGDPSNFERDRAYMDITDREDSDAFAPKSILKHPTDFKLGNHIFYFTGGVYYDSQHRRTGILKYENRHAHTYCDSTVTHPPQFCPSGKTCPNCGSKRCVCPA